VVLSLDAWVGDWTAMADPWHRAGLLLLVVAAGAATYGLVLLLMGLRPRHLRH
jgi:putative peptidoglycan lipid II flippase